MEIPERPGRGVRICVQHKEIEWHILKSAKAHDATTLHLLRPIPGIGKILSLVILYEIHDIHRFPTSQKFCSYSRLIRPARSRPASASAWAMGRWGMRI